MEQRFTFLGHTTDYWLTLQQRADELNAARLIDEIALLHAKVSFYESRLTEMMTFKERVSP